MDKKKGLIALLTAGTGVLLLTRIVKAKEEEAEEAIPQIIIEWLD